MDSASGVCSREYGTLKWAMTKCNNDNNCKWLHDHGCDDENWRFCPNIDINKYLTHRAAQRPEGCSKIQIDKSKTRKLNENKFADHQLQAPKKLNTENIKHNSYHKYYVVTYCCLYYCN